MKNIHLLFIRLLHLAALLKMTLLNYSVSGWWFFVMSQRVVVLFPRWWHHTQVVVSHGRQLPDRWWSDGASASGGSCWQEVKVKLLHWSPVWRVKIWKCVCLKEKQQQHFSTQNITRRQHPTHLLQRLALRKNRRCLCLKQTFKRQ